MQQNKQTDLPIAVNINSSAGAGCTTAWVDDLTDQFRSHGLAAAVHLANGGLEIIDLVRQASTQCQVIVAGGGDGTINAVASALVGTDIALGVLPLGTLNHFAKDLQIPLDISAAIRTIAEGHTIKVDTGEVNQRLFLNNSSLGLYPEIVRQREQQQKRFGRSKWLAFFWATIATLRRYPFLHVTLRFGNEQYRRRTPFVFVGNNEYVMEGFAIGTRQRLDAATLSLYVAQRTGRLGLLKLALHALFGRLRQAKDFELLHAKEVLIETHHKYLRVATDGEANIMATPLQYRIRPASLNVIVPKNLSP